MKIIKERTPEVITWYTYDFDRIKENGGCSFTFPCDQHGNIEKLSLAAQKNYNYCLSHINEFHHGINKIQTTYVHPAIGLCSCGEEVVLEDQYLGACQCPKCGSWYNLFGQKLIDPKYWEEDY